MNHSQILELSNLSLQSASWGFSPDGVTNHVWNGLPCHHQGEQNMTSSGHLRLPKSRHTVAQLLKQRPLMTAAFELQDYHNWTKPSVMRQMPDYWCRLKQ